MSLNEVTCSHTTAAGASISIAVITTRPPGAGMAASMTLPSETSANRMREVRERRGPAALGEQMSDERSERRDRRRDRHRHHQAESALHREEDQRPARRQQRQLPDGDRFCPGLVLHPAGDERADKSDEEWRAEEDAGAVRLQQQHAGRGSRQTSHGAGEHADAAALADAAARFRLRQHRCLNPGLAGSGGRERQRRSSAGS